jgi:ectoine hydroxylase-related dioxygenase (phytanoyl-CoA dioxygenase family)
MPLAIQVAWMMDDFTAENGATLVVPGTHLSRKKPPWSYDALEDQVTLSAPAGSLAMWFSQVWHRSGENTSERPRRALLGNYIRAWIKPHNDFTRSVPPDIISRYSPRTRYLLGWSAFGPTRG